MRFLEFVQTYLTLLLTILNFLYWVLTNCSTNFNEVCNIPKKAFHSTPPPLPQGVSPHSASPCRRCQCSGPGVTGECIRDDYQFNIGVLPGACICKEGFEVRLWIFRASLSIDTLITFIYKYLKYYKTVG